MKTIERWKQALSLVLTCALLVGMIPLMAVSAFAAEPSEIQSPASEKPVEAVIAEDPAEPDAAVPAADENVIPDPVFQAEINMRLKRDRKTPVTIKDMESFTVLTLESPSYGVKSIEGIRYAKNLKSLKIETKGLQGLEEIKHLLNLEHLVIGQNTVDLTWFQNIPNLKSLHLFHCPGFSDFTALPALPSLTEFIVVGTKELTSLNGISSAKFPSLEVLTATDCPKLEDISALRDKLPNLYKVNLSEYSKITDISPLKNYTTLRNLNLEKVKLTPENRQTYIETIQSLTNLEALYLPYCEITSEDTVMFKPLSHLKTLILNCNEIDSTAFCDNLPRNIEQLGLYGNRISNMDNLAELKDLIFLGFGDNIVTDFSFISKLPKLKNLSHRHVEGIPSAPARSHYTFSSSAHPSIIADDGTVRVKNPYIGIDGKPVSFENVALGDKDATYTVRYDAAANEIVFENVTKSHLNCNVIYNIPLSGGEVKVCKLSLYGDARPADKFTVSYNWGTVAPEGQKLPVDSNKYNSIDEAKDAMDKTFSDKTTIAGTKDGLNGTWHFSGWTATASGSEVKFSGSWSFVADKFTVSYNWGTLAPEGQKLPIDSNKYNSLDEAKDAMDKTFSDKTAIAGTKDGLNGTWHFSGWTATASGSEVKFSGSWSFVADKFTVSYNWGTVAPEGQKLPIDSNKYNSLDEAKDAMDKTFSDKTAIAGTKDGLNGTWHFSGWATNVVENEVQFTGQWAFASEKYTVVYDWGKDAPEGQKLPVDSGVYNTIEEVKASMNQSFTDKTTVSGTKDGKEGTWSFSGWTIQEDDESNGVTFRGSWKFTEKAAANPDDAPQTGDFAIQMSALLLAISAVAIVVTVYARKKQF